MVRLVWHRDTARFKHYAVYSLTSLVSVLCYRGIAAMARPAYGPNGELVDGGADLSLGGTLEYLHDVLYVTAFVHTMTLVSDWFWMVYLVIPTYASYLLWIGVVKPYVFAPGPEETSDSRADAKKKAKMEKKASRVKYMNSRR